jgi:WXG100 family type VII secretion target
MADKFQAQYQELKKIQQQILAQSDAVLQTRNKVNNQVQTLRNGMFVGDSASAFYAEMDGVVLPAMDRLKNALDRFAQETEKIQQTIASAEQNAASRFTTA